MKKASSKKTEEIETLGEMDRIAKMLVRRDLELTEIKEKREREIAELDRIAKMLVRRDFELLEIREKRETGLKKLEKKTKELEESRVALMNMLEDVEGSRKALMNMLEDVEEARGRAEEEKNKTLAVITNFADGLLVFDPENKLSLINPQAEELFDVKGRDLMGRPILELSTFPTI